MGDVVRTNVGGIARIASVMSNVGPGDALTPIRILTGVGGVIKATPGMLFKITAYNVNAAVRYLHIYNKATAPTLSTDTPLMTFALNPTSAREIDMAGMGVTFSTGIAWAFTTDDIAIPATAGTSTELHATVLYS